MSIVLQGIKFGVVLAFLIGPVFFALLQTSIERGFWKGVLVAIGISLSDTLYVVVCYLGLAGLMDEARYRLPLAYAGGGILVAFGLYHLLVKSRRSIQAAGLADEQKTYRYILKGFVINGFSPMVPLFWLGTISVATVDLGYTTRTQFFTFFLALLVTVFFTDVIKAFLAGRLRPLFTPKVMMWLNVAVGLALMGFGLRLMI
jgi:threonine/homoserine/homoserine lactone efflux protein